MLTRNIIKCKKCSQLEPHIVLNCSTCLLINDWAMKFIPQKYRESQSDWFRKRGISWHISVVYRKVHGELQSQTFIHVIQSCSQDSTAVVAILQHVIACIKNENPDLTSVYLRQDNAGCYHSSSTILACPAIEASTEVKVKCVDFSDPQGGKGAADRMAATAKCHIQLYVSEGNDVTSAEEMRDALLSHGGIEGVRVAALLRLDETFTAFLQPQKLPGISKLHNFWFEDEDLRATRAYKIGHGKKFVVSQRTGMALHISVKLQLCCMNCKFIYKFIFISS